MREKRQHTLSNKEMKYILKMLGMFRIDRVRIAECNEKLVVGKIIGDEVVRKDLKL